MILRYLHESLLEPGVDKLLQLQMALINFASENGSYAEDFLLGTLFKSLMLIC